MTVIVKRIKGGGYGTKSKAHYGNTAKAQATKQARIVNTSQESKG